MKPSRKKRVDGKSISLATSKNRYDNLSNDFLGYGTSRDKLAYGTFVAGLRVSDVELNAMYYSDDVAAKIVNARPTEMMRRGYKLTAKDPEKAAALQDRGKDLGLDACMLKNMQWARLYGGSLMVMGATDSDDMTKPLVPERVKDVKFINVIDRRYSQVTKWQENPLLADYGKPLLYTVGGPIGGFFAVHATRVIRFDGVEETDPVTRRQLAGWTYSCLQRPYNVLQKFATVFESIGQLVADASQGVWKIKDLLEMLASNKDELMTRIAFSDMTRSSGRAIMVDAEVEDFSRVTTSFSGLDVIADRFMMRVAAAADMPVTLLFGRSAAGMNATGDSDFRAWYGVLATEQENTLKPALLRAYTILAGKDMPEDLDIEFTPLWEPTDKEALDAELVQAQIDKIYIDATVVHAEEVAIARFGSGEGEIEIDEASLLKSRDLEIDLMLNPPPPPPVGATGVPPVPGAPAPKTPGNVPPPQATRK